MSQLWREEAPYIEILGVHHLIYVAIFVTAVVLLLVNRRKVRVWRNRIAAVLLVVSILQQMVLYGWFVVETGFEVSRSLPLHISRISSLLGIIFLITKNTKVLDVLFYFGLFAYGSFSYPNQIYPAYHLIGIEFAINHAMTLLLPFFGYIAYNWRPKLKGFLKAYGLFLLYFVFIYLFNILVDGNYFYLEERLFLQSWPEYVYVPVLLVTVFAGFFLACVAVQAIGKLTGTASEER